MYCRFCLQRCPSQPQGTPARPRVWPKPGMSSSTDSSPRRRPVSPQSTPRPRAARTCCTRCVQAAQLPVTVTLTPTPLAAHPRDVEVGDRMYPCARGSCAQVMQEYLPGWPPSQPPGGQLAQELDDGRWTMRNKQGHGSNIRGGRGARRLERPPGIKGDGLSGLGATNLQHLQPARRSWPGRQPSQPRLQLPWP